MRIRPILGILVGLCFSGGGFLVIHGIRLRRAMESLSYSAHQAVFSQLRASGRSALECSRLISLGERQTEELKAMVAGLVAQADLFLAVGVSLFGLAILSMVAWRTSLRSHR